MTIFSCTSPKQIKTGFITTIALMVTGLPAEIFDAEKFIEVSEHAEYCAVKRLRDAVKLKLRTPGRLYTLKVKPEEAEVIMKKLKCEVREV